MADQSLKHQNLILSLNQLQFEYFNSQDSFILIKFLIFEVVQKSKATVLTKNHQTKIDIFPLSLLFKIKLLSFSRTIFHFHQITSNILGQNQGFNLLNSKQNNEEKNNPSRIPSLLADTIHI